MRRDQPLMNVDLFLNEITLSGWADVACRNTVHELPVGLTSLYIRIPKTPRTEHGKNDLHYCQRGLPFTSSGGRTESVWKCDIRLGCKALRLKGSEADRLHYCQLGKMASRSDRFVAQPLVRFVLRIRTTVRAALWSVSYTWAAHYGRRVRPAFYIV